MEPLRRHVINTVTIIGISLPNFHCGASPSETSVDQASRLGTVDQISTRVSYDLNPSISYHIRTLY